MTALADVLFQLLIFFMLSANLAAYSLLPLRSGALRGESGGETVGAGTAVTEASTTAIWTLNPDGIVASGQRFGIDRLQALADALALRQTQHVLIILRPDVPVQNVATVLELLSAQGISSVQIAVMYSRDFSLQIGRNAPAALCSSGITTSGAVAISASMNASDPVIPLAERAKLEISAAFSGLVMKSRKA